MSKLKKKLHSFSTPPWWFYPTVFLIVFFVYSLTVNPSLFRNDSPETITACFTLGVSHPPGYPLHTLLGHIFSLIPLGNPAMTINYFSAFLGALGACLFAANLWMLLKSLPPNTDKKNIGVLFGCLIGTFCFAFSKSYWSVSLAAKGGIYNLQVVLELAFFLFMLIWIQPPSSKTNPSMINRIYFLVFIFSVGLINQWPSLMLLVPALTLGILLYSHYNSAATLKNFGTRHVLTTMTIVIIVLSLYLYLPLRSNLNPVLNFGAPSDIQRFLASLFRASYFKTETVASFIPTALSTIQDKSVYISNRFGAEFSDLFSLFSLLGVLILLRRGFKIVLLFLLLLLLTTIVANILYLQVAPIEYWHLDDHLLTVNWATAFLASIGIYYFLSLSSRHTAAKYGGLLLLTLLPALTFYKNLNFDNQTREFLYRGYGMEALKSMNLNADYYAESDYDYFSILYLREIEHKRQDIGLTLTSFMKEKDWDYLFEEEATQPHDLRPIYCAFPNGDFINGYLKRAPRASFMPVGTVIQFLPTEAFDEKKSIKLLRELMNRYIAPKLINSNPINKLLLELCAHPYLNLADYQKLRHNLDHWVELHVYAIGLISNETWRAEEEEKAAEGDVLLGKKMMAAINYWTAGYDYFLSGQKIKAKNMYEKAINVDPTSEHVPYIKRDLDSLNIQE